MSVNAINTVPATLLRPAETARPRLDQERAPVVPGQQQPVTTPPRADKVGLLAPRHEVLPSEPPAGTDPELWQVLTSEERAYFARLTSLGPLTYGRPASSPVSSETPLDRGGRIDVRA
jgi:hypothetical protein